MVEANLLEEEISPRKITKKYDQSGRKQLAKDVIDNRNERQRILSEQDLFQEKKQELESQISERWRLLSRNKKLLEHRANSWLSKIIFRVKAKDSVLARYEDDQIKLRVELQALADELEALKQTLQELGDLEQNMPEARELLNAYYEKAAESPLSKEQKTDLLKPELLSQLSLEEYIALWKRLNPYFLSHVTQQGFRDHTGGDLMLSHDRGLLTFSNGFLDVMENGKALLPVYSRLGLVDHSEQSVRDFLSNIFSYCSTAQEAKNELIHLVEISTKASAIPYADFTAVHLAAEIVSNRYYGGESDNEVFFVYPADFLASQYNFHFSGFQKDFTQPQSETKWNDVFVWGKDGQAGLSIDAGIVFLPEKTLVDPETGSKYSSAVTSKEGGYETRELITDSELKEKLLLWFQQSIQNQDNDLSKLLFSWKESEYGPKRDVIEKTFFDQCSQSLSDYLPLYEAQLLAGDIFDRMKLHSANSSDIDIFQSFLVNRNVLLKRPQQPIRSKEYWESFFEKNPNLKPARVVYYSGNPTRAVDLFLKKNGIGKADTSEVEGKLLGFTDNHIHDMESDQRIVRGKDELVEIANRIINEHYQQGN